MIIGLAACSKDEAATDTGTDVNKKSDISTAGTESDATVATNPAVNTNVDPDSWVIYWYLCGSDLETKWGCATTDMTEMFQVALPDNVKVVIQTGGSAEWQNEFTDSSMLYRYVYSGTDLLLADAQPSASMGAAQTLYDFLDFADANFNAGHKALVFWNHGGGSLDGAAFDELYDYDSISLVELYDVLNTRYGATSSISNPEFDLIGFDTCLMATIDVANVLQNFAGYLVASEETEPGNGWYYTGWLGDLAANPSMDGRTLGKAICDRYYEGCELAGTESEVTLSLTDLSKVPALLDAYKAYGEDCLALASQDPGFFTEFYRSAINSENYGGNTKEQGYTNMVDLGHLAQNTMEYIPSSAAFLKALEDANVYKVKGRYRAESTGLSGYYSYDFDQDSLYKFNAVGASEPLKYLFAYELTGEMGSDMEAYVSSLDISEFAAIETMEGMGWDGAKFDFDSEGSAYVCLGEAAADIISDIRLMLFYMDQENDTMMFMGEDNNIVCDWENGIFTENFYGTWGCINGTPVYMERTYGDDVYNLYSVPVLLNGEEYNLQVAYAFADGQYYVLGARQGIDASGMASKELRQLEYGDEIDIIWQLTSFENPDDFEMYTVETAIVDENFEFTDDYLEDGQYGMVFVMRDAYGNESMTDAVLFDIIDGEIFTSVTE